MPHVSFSVPRDILARARAMRSDASDAESRMWFLLRNRRFGGYKFRRQHPVGRYILDFYCPDRHLGIELDGGQHFEPDQRRYDERRTLAVSQRGITLIRFRNDDVLARTEEVLGEIWRALGEE